MLDLEKRKLKKAEQIHINITTKNFALLANFLSSSNQIAANIVERANSAS
jgi:hypothetical protein